MALIFCFFLYNIQVYKTLDNADDVYTPDDMVLQLFHLESVLHGFLRIVDGVPTAITQHGRPLSDQLLPQGLSKRQQQSTIVGQ